MHIGLDFGSFNTTITRGDETRRVPSVIAVDESGDVVAVGEPARAMRGRAPSHIRTVSPVRRGAIADLPRAQEYLRRVLGQELGWRRRVSSVTLLIPPTLSRLQQNAFLEAVRGAGVRRVQPADRDLAGSRELAGRNAVLVVDVGGQTTRATVFSRGKLVLAQAERVGGEDLTQAVRRYLYERHQLDVGEDEAERIKREIGCAVSWGESATVAGGRHTVTALPHSARVQAVDVNPSLAAPLEHILEAPRRVLRGLPAALSGDLYSSGIALTGGGSRLDGMDRYFENALGVPVRRIDDFVGGAL